MTGVRKKRMIHLGDLLSSRIAYEYFVDGNPEIAGIKYDSRQVDEGDLFVAIKGEKKDGNVFVSKAIERGAVVIVSEDNPVEKHESLWVKTDDARAALSDLSDSFFRSPSEKMKVIGVTGTNGKTSTTYIINSIFKSGRKKVGIIGTISYQIGEKKIEASRTTPEAPEVHGYLAEMNELNIPTCVMEVSSHSLALKRVDDVKFDIALFTNLTSDHLDYHLTLEDYYQAKKKLFSLLKKNGVSIINIDDMYGQRLLRELSEKNENCITYGKNPEADIRVAEYSLHSDRTEMIIYADGEEIKLKTPLLGETSIYNITASVAVALQSGISKEDIMAGVDHISTIPGRMERIDMGQKFDLYVDYAHTPDALMRLLQSARMLTKGKLITVFGCGGDRDKTKRPMMGQHAVLLGDVTIITNDNPRTEDPHAIISDIVDGIHAISETIEYEIINDREKAIRRAIEIADEGDTVVIAGKGHEDYQIIGTEVFNFDDREVARKLLEIKIRAGLENVDNI